MGIRYGRVQRVCSGLGCGTGTTTMGFVRNVAGADGILTRTYTAAANVNLLTATIAKGSMDGVTAMAGCTLDRGEDVSVAPTIGKNAGGVITTYFGNRLNNTGASALAATRGIVVPHVAIQMAMAATATPGFVIEAWPYYFTRDEIYGVPVEEDLMQVQTTNIALKEIADNTLDLVANTLKVVLLLSNSTMDALWASSSTVKALLTLDQIDANEVATATGYTRGFAGAGRKTLGTKVFAADATLNGGKMTAAAPGWTALAAGTGTIGYFAIVKEITNDAGSRIISLGKLDVTQVPNGNDFQLPVPDQGFIPLR